MSDDRTADRYSNYEFRSDHIWCADFHQEVMMEWERPLMERMAAEVCHNAGDVLEVGFGMGVSAGCIQRYRPRSHTLVECHPQVLPRLRDWASDKPTVHIVEGMWQDTLESLGQYDGILWDTFGGVDSFSNRTLFPRFFEFVKAALRPLGRFTFWNPMPEPIATWKYGLEGVAWESIPVSPPPNEYFNFTTYCMPLWIQEPESSACRHEYSKPVPELTTEDMNAAEASRVNNTLSA
jgi:SAM-dependent methyltransferase